MMTAWAVAPRFQEILNHLSAPELTNGWFGSS
jgi:hypothetical protein